MLRFSLTAAGAHMTIKAMPLESIEDLLKNDYKVKSLLRGQKFDILFRTGNHEELCSEALADLRANSEEAGARFYARLHLERFCKLTWDLQVKPLLSRRYRCMWNLGNSLDRGV